ncbi:MAG: ABC transporter permease [Bacteroidota bacterium]|nr:ABC transporter permease [Bacteroidota bacterium]
MASKRVNDFFLEAANLTVFTGQFFRELFHGRFEFREFTRQSYQIGYKSLTLISIIGFILGFVLTLQSRPMMVTFGAEDWLPGMVSISIVREIGPLITALICAGKIGSSIGAELGSMRVTEQIDAMEVSASNPMKFIVVTRVMATSLMIPLLVFYSDAIAFLGSYLAINLNAHLSPELFISQAFSTLDFGDFLPATIKTIFFGFAIGIIGCYKGYYANKGTEGVGQAANSAVVASSLAMFIIDIVAVQLDQIF